MTDSIKFPVWFTALTWLFFASNLFVFGLMALLFPSIPFPDAGEGANFPIQFLAIRHVAFAFPLLYGLLRKDVKVLTVMYTIFVIMSFLDIVWLGLYGYDIPVLGLIPFIGQLPTVGKVIVGIGAFLTPVSASLWYLTSKVK
ncbi:MAG: hypothetical protein AAF629_03180 [Chloroflexota bacterium]